LFISTLTGKISHKSDSLGQAGRPDVVILESRTLNVDQLPRSQTIPNIEIFGGKKTS